MKVRLWGTRGSTPAGTAQTSRFGSNTTCVEVRLSGGGRIILDAGSGLYALGQLLRTQAAGSCTLCFTHMHWDHVQGLPMWPQLHDARWNITLAAVRRAWEPSLWDDIAPLFDGRHFPLRWEQLSARPALRELPPDADMTVEGAHLSACPTCHPGGNTAWRVDAGGWSFVFTGDHEWGVEPDTDARLMAFAAGADVLLVDAHFIGEEYEQHRGWGHSRMESWVEPAAAAGVRALIFTHHAPEHDDHELTSALDSLRRTYAALPLSLHLASEGMECVYAGDSVDVREYDSIGDCPLCDFSREISSLSDTGVIMDSILSEARRLGRADAGTMYLVEDGELVFAHTQNDTLFPGSAARKHNYLNARLPLNTASIAGYVAVKGETLNLANVRELPASVPYSFNCSFDNATGYRTVSMLTAPLLDKDGRVSGVLQVINSMEDGEKVPFSICMQKNIERLAALGAGCIERGRMTREMILRMLHTSALRDPLETASHVLRVGAVTAELYERWAEQHGEDPEIILRTKANLRLAAMLHDVGKVGIPDAVLKKKGKLTAEEFAVIKSHCGMGAGLFSSITNEIDEMARNIAQHHHQKWDGSGYTGDPSLPSLAGEDIPREARFTAVADVYDALVSPRCYKEGWPPEKARAQLREDAGTHFDPEIVDVFLGMNDVVDAIYLRYPFEVPVEEA